MPVYEKISAVVSLTLIGLVLYFVLEFSTQSVTIMLFGSPLTLEPSRQWFMTCLLAGLAIAGTDTVIRSHPVLPSRRLSYSATFWILPGLLVILATQTLGFAPSPVIWGVALVALGFLLWLIIIAEYRQVLPTASRWAYLWQKLLAYGLALAFFFLIYQTRSRSALSAIGILLISGTITLSLLRQDPESISTVWLFAAIVGLVMGQITWALNYWRTSTLSISLLLFLIFYVLTGLAQQQLLGRLSRRTLWEFGAVAVVALLLVILNL